MYGRRRTAARRRALTGTYRMRRSVDRKLTREGTLIHTKQGACGSQLRCGDQCRLRWIDVLNMDYNRRYSDYDAFRGSGTCYPLDCASGSSDRERRADMRGQFDVFPEITARRHLTLAEWPASLGAARDERWFHLAHDVAPDATRRCSYAFARSSKSTRYMRPASEISGRTGCARSRSPQCSSAARRSP